MSISIYYCITNYPKSWWLKTTPFIISQFLCVRNPCGLAGSSGSGSFTRPQSKCHLELQSSPGSTGAESTSKFTQWLLAGFSSLITVVLRASVPSCLLASGCPQFFATRAAHNMKLASSKLEEPEPTKEKSQFFIPHLGSDLPSLFSLQASH